MSERMTMLRMFFYAVCVVVAGWALTAAGQTAPGTMPRLASEAGERASVPEQGQKSGQPGNLSFMHLLTEGGWAMFPLGACSLVGLALAIERSLALRRSNIAPRGFMDGLRKVYRGREDTEAGLAYCRSNPSAIARILAVGIRKLQENPKAAETAMMDQGVTEVSRMRKNLRLLHGISAITPTLGLLGTVWGMIKAFEAASRVGLGHLDVLTTGIYEALVATMVGLLIAVPVLVFYYAFLGIIDRAVLEFNDSCQEFLERHDTPTGTTLTTQAVV